jgi:outer membrane protein assembly factor BamB
MRLRLKWLHRWLVAGLVLASIESLPGDDWPQWLGPRRDSVWREGGILERFPVEGPKVRWRVRIGGGYAGPAVAEGRVYVLDRQLPRGAGDAGLERVLCLKAADGELVWKHEYDCPYTASYPAGPRATPLAAAGQVFSLGAEGNLCCLDAETGRLLWSRDFKRDYGVKTPVWGFAAHPLLEGKNLICLVGGDPTVVAFDAQSGKEVWRAFKTKEPGYAPPVMIEANGKRQLIIWHPEAVNALNAETGQVYWSVPFKIRDGLCIATARQLGDQLFLTAFYDGSLMLSLGPSQAEILWRSKKSSERDTDYLHAIMCTPFLEDGHIYGVCSYGQLRCLRADTGERLWETLAATTSGKETRWANAFIAKNGDRFFLFNEKGDLIIAKLTPHGYEELSRAHLLEPVNRDPGRAVVWSHPAFANRCIYARNDQEIICASLAAE